MLFSGLVQVEQKQTSIKRGISIFLFCNTSYLSRSLMSVSQCIFYLEVWRFVKIIADCQHRLDIGQTSHYSIWVPNMEQGTGKSIFPCKYAPLNNPTGIVFAQRCLFVKFTIVCCLSHSVCLSPMIHTLLKKKRILQVRLFVKYVCLSEGHKT